MEDQLKHRSDKGLDKEQLAEIRKGEITANQLDPVGQQGQNVETLVVIIQKVKS